MRATIDGGGRVVIPKAMRERLGLRAGTEVEIIERDGNVEIGPVPTKFWIDDTDGHVVLRTDREMPPLTTEMVREVIEQLRR